MNHKQLGNMLYDDIMRIVFKCIYRIIALLMLKICMNNIAHFGNIINAHCKSILLVSDYVLIHRLEGSAIQQSRDNVNVYNDFVEVQFRHIAKDCTAATNVA